MLKAPALSRERAAWAEGQLLVGVDEVGRGPLAGPVVAAAVAFPPFAGRILRLRDSKVLTARRREQLASLILRRAAAIGLGAASPRVIDRINIRVATALAMRRAVARAVGPVAPRCRVTILIDGLPLPELGRQHEALVDGDALCYSVAAAGVVAKVVRDRLMLRLARRHPAYAWDSNMGYGTREHLDAIHQVGPSPHHRRSFMPVVQMRLTGF